MAKFAHQLRSAIADLEAAGLVVVTGDVVALTEKAYEEIAGKAGWLRGEDADDTPCFLNSRGTHEYSYAPDWQTLCIEQALVGPITAPRGHA